MSTEFYNFSGTCKWARLVKPDQKYERWTINVYLDKKSRALFDKSGLQLSIRSDDDGDFVTFARPVKKLFGNELRMFEPPTCQNKDLAPMDPMKVGNGSKVKVNVAVYDTKKGKGHRLEGVTVLELVEYKPQ